MREVTIALGGREFTAPQRTIRKEVEWRKLAQEALGPLWDATSLLQMDVNQPGDLRTMIDKVGALLDPGAALDDICAYAPQLADERDWIEENTYSDEVFGALVGLFFGQLRQLERLPQAMNGSLPRQASTTSPS